MKNGPVTLTVKRGGQLLAKTPMTITNGRGSALLTISGANPGDQLYLEFSSRSTDPNLASLMKSGLALATVVSNPNNPEQPKWPVLSIVDRDDLGRSPL